MIKQSPPKHAGWHGPFSVAGFYDSGQHIVIVPGHEDKLDEIISHEASHAKITGNSSLGYLQQLAVLCENVGNLCGEVRLESFGGEMNQIISSAVVDVHEASAWLVSEFVTSGAVKPPEIYEKTAYPMRITLSKLAKEYGREFYSFRDDFDPLFCTPVHILQSAASFALSPPCVPAMLKASVNDQLTYLRRALQTEDEMPIRRWNTLAKQLRGTQIDVVKAWTKWVRSWYFGNVDEETSNLYKGSFFSPLPRLKHSGAVKSQVKGDLLSRIVAELCSANNNMINNFVKSYEEQFRPEMAFEPHIDPLYQICVVAVPRLEHPYFYKGQNPFPDLNQYFTYVIVSGGEGDGFGLKQTRDGNVTIRFCPQEDDKAVIWHTDLRAARHFLVQWSSRDKGILIASQSYSFTVGEVILPASGSKVLLVQDLPHVVVAVTDVRTLWNKMTLFNKAAVNGSRKILVGVIKSDQEEYIHLVLTNEDHSVIIVTPALARLAEKMSGMQEELRIPSAYQIRFAQQTQMIEVTKKGGTSLLSAFHALTSHFDN